VSPEAVPSLLATLVERLQGQESLEVEFKAARNDLPRDLWPTVSAFANTEGGWIVLGVAERDNEPAIEGVADPQRILTNFWDLLRNRQRFSHEVCRAGDVCAELVDGKQVIVIRVPAAPRRVRPVHMGRDPYQGTYVRRHAGDYRCTEDEVQRMIREASDTPSDYTALPKFGLEDLDPETLAGYRRYCQTQNPSAPRNRYDERRFLESIGAYRRDRELDVEGLTVAGLLLLGKEEAIREWRPRHLIDYRLLPSGFDDADQRWEDRLVWEGNLWDAFHRVYPRLTKDLETPFRLAGAVRAEGAVQEVLREALVNLLVHADYSERQTSLVVRSPDGFLFRNPGSSRVSERDLWTGDHSDPRNPSLVRMFRFTGLAEEAGSGIPRIIRTWHDRGFQLPRIDVGTERYEFTLELRHVHLLSEEDRAWLQALGEGWTEAEQLALVAARHEGDVDNLRLRHLTGQHPADATKILIGLRNRGYLQMTGAKRGASYQLSTQGTAAHISDQGASPEQEGQSVAQLSLLGTDLNLPDNGGSLGGNEPNLPDNGGSLGGNEPNLPDMESAPGEAPPALWSVWEDLRAIARPARERRRLSTEVRSEIIARLCAVAPLGPRELGQLMARQEDYIRDVIRPLLADGRLRYQHPEQPSHPRQKYIASTPQESAT
jgi:ATP-dependent DNA helicase RecG